MGPIIGAIIGVWAYFLFIEFPTPVEKVNNNNNNNSNVETPNQRKLNSFIDYTISGINGRNSINGEIDQNVYSPYNKTRI